MLFGCVLLLTTCYVKFITYRKLRDLYVAESCYIHYKLHAIFILSSISVSHRKANKLLHRFYYRFLLFFSLYYYYHERKDI